MVDAQARIVIDHATVGVSDLRRSREFYRHALVPLGFAEIGPWREGAHEIEFGLEDAADFAISTAYGTGAPIHLAFGADRRDQVDAFYAAALEAGGRDNGAPGLRPEYSDGYYGAFVLDLSQAGFRGDFETRDSSLEQGIPLHAPTQEVSR